MSSIWIGCTLSIFLCSHGKILRLRRHRILVTVRLRVRISLVPISAAFIIPDGQPVVRYARRFIPFGLLLGTWYLESHYFRFAEVCAQVRLRPVHWRVVLNIFAHILLGAARRYCLELVLQFGLLQLIFVIQVIWHGCWIHLNRHRVIIVVIILIIILTDLDILVVIYCLSAVSRRVQRPKLEHRLRLLMIGSRQL